MPISKNSPVRAIAFISVAAIGLLAYGLVLEFRYMWYLRPEDIRIVRGVEFVVLALFLVLWLKFPSRLAAAVVATGGLAAPPLIHGEVFVGWDLPFVLFASIPAIVLVAATHIRRKWVAARSQDQSEATIAL